MHIMIKLGLLTLSSLLISCNAREPVREISSIELQISQQSASGRGACSTVLKVELNPQENECIWKVTTAHDEVVSGTALDAGWQGLVKNAHDAAYPGAMSPAPADSASMYYLLRVNGSGVANSPWYKLFENEGLTALADEIFTMIGEKGRTAMIQEIQYCVIDEVDKKAFADLKRRVETSRTKN